jgi:hypothetical protein
VAPVEGTLVAVEAAAAMPGHGSQGTGEESTREGWIYWWSTDATEESRARVRAGGRVKHRSRAAVDVWASMSAAGRGERRGGGR